MTKNTINRPGQQPAVQRQPRQEEPQSSSKPSTSNKIKDKKSAQKQERVAPQRPQRQQRAQAPAAAQGGGAAGAAGEAEGGEGQGGAGGVGSADAGEELNRRRGGEVVWERKEEVERHEELVDTAAVGADAIKRGKGGDNQNKGGGDGFDQGKNQREAYEKMLKGNVNADKERFDELRSKGHRDDFRPDKDAKEVEALGIPRATAHVVRLYDSWTLDGVPRDDAVPKMASFLAEFQSAQNIKKVLTELENKPIRDVYPLEVLMHMLETRPELLPGVRPGNVLSGLQEQSDGRKILAGYPIQIAVPSDVRLKSFALLGGARPGYEFHPSKDEGKYTLLVDTPGHWKFAVLAVPLQSLGRIQKESGEGILEIFEVTVNAMGKKNDPISPEEWAKMMEQEDELSGDDDGAGDDVAGPQEPVVANPAPLLAMQIRKALEEIRRDENSASGATSASATTYSWDCTLYKPGAPMNGEPIFHVVVERAGPFDAAWHRAREAIAAKQKEYEPARAPITQDDFTQALRRARVR